ncbi:MAG: hypothetical protein ACXWYT_07815, partial [Actinomycetota bacterium]
CARAVTVGASTGCSSASFTVGSAGSILRVCQIGAVSNTSGVVQNTMSLTMNTRRRRVSRWSSGGRGEHPEQINNILPMIEPMMRKLGYQVDGVTTI